MERFRNATYRSVRAWEDPVVSGVAVAGAVLIWFAAEVSDVGLLSFCCTVVQMAVLCGLVCKALKADVSRYKDMASGVQIHETLRLARPALRDAISTTQTALTWAHPSLSVTLTAVLTVASVVASYISSLDFAMLCFLAAAFYPLIAARLNKGKSA
eukprot:TRINITY_DN36908_c0_g1_i1.p1 TRINITY_DN36908_c0_g1~~TRINITY_DN36908_c0_g1_i1.p1  ORF type:complete len:168 (+),score=7.73 TRINITY_DN36908_c0_g1_i1:39-506(+)